MIEPLLEKDGFVRDEVVEKLESVWHLKEAKMHFMGYHDCICGERSDNAQWMLHGMITNSLAFHYLIYHRYEVPQSEIDKIMSLPAPDKVVYQEANDDEMIEINRKIFTKIRDEGIIKLTDEQIFDKLLRMRAQLRKERKKQK